MPASEGRPTDRVLANRDYYDRFAPNYERRRHHGYHKMIDELQTKLLLNSVRGQDVLEVGCGTGLILRQIAPLARRAVGIDLSSKMLESAHERGLTASIASATCLPFRSHCFDVCYSFKVLSHVRQLGAALSEMSRVVRPGGRLFIELYNRHSLRYLLRRLRGGRPIAAGIDDNQVFVRFFTPAQMLRALPDELLLVRLHGVRLLTLLPAMVSWPLLGPWLQRAEARLTSTGLARFGGFVVLECIKR